MNRTGQRVKKNEEIKRYEIRLVRGLLGPCVEYEQEGCGDWCKASDITLMIEQMRAMKDQIEQLTKDMDDLNGWSNKLCKETEVLNKTRSIPGTLLQWRIIFEVIDNIKALSKDNEEV